MLLISIKGGEVTLVCNFFSNPVKLEINVTLLYRVRHIHAPFLSSYNYKYDIAVSATFSGCKMRIFFTYFGPIEVRK